MERKSAPVELNKEEAEKFAAFKHLCAEHGLLERPKELETVDVQDGINDELTLFRYFKAGRLNIQRSLRQLQDAAEFHRKNHAFRMYEGIRIQAFEETRKLYPHWTGRRDKRGLPILMFDMAHYTSEALAHWRKTRDIPCCPDPTIETTEGPNMAQRVTVHYDNLTRFVLPLCTAMRDRPNPTVPISNVVYIVDASAISLKQGWNLREFAQEISSLLVTCYPETIERIFVCNVPLYFSTADVYSTLEKYINKEHIPEKFGGGFTFKHGMLPDLDNGIRQALHWKAPTTHLDNNKEVAAALENSLDNEVKSGVVPKVEAVDVRKATDTKAGGNNMSNSTTTQPESNVSVKGSDEYVKYISELRFSPGDALTAGSSSRFSITAGSSMDSITIAYLSGLESAQAFLAYVSSSLADACNSILTAKIEEAARVVNQEPTQTKNPKALTGS
ncbi:hypothetical protein BBP40_009069 [Aspergillus hancockii]|nr:hypothetical protein BBP40_009069 [Aspergillus hancockii]